MKHCLNCGNGLQDDHRFCPNCAQKSNVSKIKTVDLLRDFTNNLFNFDNKLWKTLIDIWIPGKIAKNYLQGMRKTYSNPLRLFSVMLIGYFTILAFSLKEDISNINAFNENQTKNAWKTSWMIKYDSIMQASEVDSAFAMKKKIFDIERSELEDFVYNTIYLKHRTDLGEDGFDLLRDTIESDSTLTKEMVRAVMDSIIQQRIAQGKDERELQLNIHTSNGKSRLMGISAEEYLILTPEELLKKYGTGQTWADKSLLQLQKILKDIGNSLKFLIGNGIWLIVLMVSLISLLFRVILYVRHDYTYAEHMVFHIIGHSRALLLGIISMLIDNYTVTDLGDLIFTVACLIYLFLGMKQFYGQSALKTTLKYLMTLLSYLIFLLICGILVFILSFVFI